MSYVVSVRCLDVERAHLAKTKIIRRVERYGSRTSGHNLDCIDASAPLRNK